MGNETYMGIYYEKIDYMGFTWYFIWGMGFYMGKPHVIKICMEIYHRNIIWGFSIQTSPPPVVHSLGNRREDELLQGSALRL